MSRLPELAPAALSFQFLAEIASGATTRIDLCRSVGSNRYGELLAVKRLHPHFAEDPTAATRFLDEVWMTAALKHANVVEVAGWGNDEHGNYLAVELVQGVSLARLMKTVFETGEAFPERLIVHVVAQICRGLVAAHGVRSRDGSLLNLVHRDLTPGNVLIGFKGEVKIADFGLAKSALRMTRTLSGTLKGEPTYMAPEQARGAGVDRRSDLFSLGVILFELFAGKHPWSAATDYEMLKVVATQPPADLRELRPKIDKELVSIVMRCLEKDPAARFQSADEVHARLDSWLRGHGYLDGSEEALGRFVRRNAMRQMRWFERAVSGNLAGVSEPSRAGLAALTGPQHAASVEAAVRGGTNVLEPPPAHGPAGALGEDATDFDAKVSSFYAVAPAPTIREAETVDENSHADELPTGEVVDEMPTIVKGDLRALVKKEVARSAAAAAAASPGSNAGADPEADGAERGRSRGPYPSYYSIVEEDSDHRPTSVKPSQRIGALVPGGGPAVRQGRPLVAPAPDAESEEVPTVPLSPSANDMSVALRPRASGAAALTPSGVRVAPGANPPQARAQARAPGPRSDPTQLQPRPYNLPPATQPPVFDPRGRSQGVRDTGMTLPTAPLPPYEGAPRADHERDAERAAQEPAQAGDRLRGESDRLKGESARLREEARVAVAQAERKVAMANVAAHIATMATEALRIAPSAGVPRASQHLDEALTIEQAMHRAAAAPLALPPDAGIGPISAGHEQEDLLAKLGLAHLASPSMLSMSMSMLTPRSSSRPPRPMSSRPPPRSVRSGPGSGYSRPGMPGFSPAGNPQPGTSVPRAPPMPDFSGTSRMDTLPLTSLDQAAAGRPYTQREGAAPAGYPMGQPQPPPEMAIPPPGSAVGMAGTPFMQNPIASSGVGNTNLDALRFRAQLQPMFLGMPRTVALAIAMGAFSIVLMLLWFFFS